MKRFLKVFYFVVLAFLGLVALLLIVSVFPITGNYSIKIVQSGSMEPAIKTGSIVLIKPADNYREGDIITFSNRQDIKEPVTHRIVASEVIEGNLYYITQGDANNTPDQRKVQTKEIIGKVLLDIPYLGYAVNAAQKPIGFMLIIIIPAVIIVYDEFRKIWREIKKMKNKKKDQRQDQKIEKLEDEIEELEDKIKEE